MEGQFQTSFIPKRPLTQKVPGAPNHSTNYFMISMVVVLVTTIALAGGVFGYNSYIQSRNDDLKNQLAAAIQKLPPNFIDEMSRLDTRIESTKFLLSKHVALSSFFDFLSRSTLKSVRFSSFQYTFNENRIEVTMAGQAQSFSSVALQAEAYAQPENLPYIGNAAFTSLALDKSGNVTFVLTAVISPDVYLYAKKMSGATLPSAPEQALPIMASSTDGVIITGGTSTSSTVH